jgi:hypothetical protein
MFYLSRTGAKRIMPYALSRNELHAIAFHCALFRSVPDSSGRKKLRNCFGFDVNNAPPLNTASGIFEFGRSLQK